ncbi:MULTISPECIES: hypothetical protein [Cytobacillus]|nr:hypothetical protein [Cytobacillus firmus]
MDAKIPERDLLEGSSLENSDSRGLNFKAEVYEKAHVCLADLSSLERN